MKKLISFFLLTVFASFVFSYNAEATAIVSNDAKLGVVVPKGEIGTGTPVYFNMGQVTTSSVGTGRNAALGQGTFQGVISDYIFGRPNPYEIRFNGKVIGYLPRKNIQRVNQLRANSIPDGSVVRVTNMSMSVSTKPTRSANNETFWLAGQNEPSVISSNGPQYLSPIRLVKNGVCVGFTNRENIQLVK